MRFSDIHYLRWARQPPPPDPHHVSLSQSGMPPPDPSFAEGLRPSEWLLAPSEDHPPLAERLAESWGLSPRQVLIQPGSHWTILVLLAHRLRRCPGPVVVEAPAYEPLRRIPEALGAELLRLPRQRENRYALDPEALEKLAARRPSVLVVTHPHNPSGAPLSSRDIDLLEQWSRDTGCAVLSDEVYLEFLPDASTSTLVGRIPQAASVHSFTKVMGLGTLRCSAAVGPEDWIAGAASFTDHGPVLVPGPSQALAARAWDRRQSLWDRARRWAARGRARVAEWSEAMRGHLEVPLFDAGIICFPRLDDELQTQAIGLARRGGVVGPFGYGLDAGSPGSHVWIEALLRQEGVGLVPGAFFEDPAAFRLGYGLEPARLEAGLERLERFLRRVMEEA